MPAFNFKLQFVGLIVLGRKRSTIRAPRKDGRKPKPGDMLYLFTGMRTKKCRQLLEARCTGATPIRITRTAVYLGKKKADYVQQTAVALCDGFNDVHHMREFFERTHGLPFRGYWIEW